MFKVFTVHIFGINSVIVIQRDNSTLITDTLSAITRHRARGWTLASVRVCRMYCACPHGQWKELPAQMTVRRLSSTRSISTSLLMLHGHKNKQHESFRKLTVQWFLWRTGPGCLQTVCASPVYTDQLTHISQNTPSDWERGKTKSNYAASPVSSEVRLHICIGNLAKVIITTL